MKELSGDARLPSFVLSLLSAAASAVTIPGTIQNSMRSILSGADYIRW